MSGPELPEDVPPEHVRTRILWALGLALAVQLVIPLTYYLRDDRYDERFAWRMFSAVRVERCQTAASEMRGGVARDIPLSRIHSAWVEHLRRNRLVVIERFLEQRCALGAERVAVQNHCIDAGGRGLPVRSYTQSCAAGGAR